MKSPERLYDKRPLPSSRTLTFKLGPSAQPLLWKWVLFAWEWKIMSISKAEHLTSFGYRGPENSEMAYYRSSRLYYIRLKSSENICYSSKEKVPFFLLFSLDEWNECTGSSKFYQDCFNLRLLIGLKKAWIPLQIQTKQRKSPLTG